MDLKHYIDNTDLTHKQIAAKLGIPWKRVFNFHKNNYTVEQRRERAKKSWSNAKLHGVNAMRGKVGELHHNHIGDVSDNKGYLMRLKPDWYTGRANSKHVFVHSLVVCELLGLTEIPRGWCVHHCDVNPLNNDAGNLVMCTVGDHQRIHRHLLAGATTISKESTLKWVEAHGTPWRDDIV